MGIMDIYAAENVKGVNKIDALLLMCFLDLHPAPPSPTP